MPFFSTQPYQLYGDDVGNIFISQGGVLYYTTPPFSPVSPTPTTFPPSTGGGGGTWGSIIGTITAQTDLNAALLLKANAASPVLTGVVTHAGADLIVGTAVSGPGNPVDFMVGKNTLTLTAATTVTFSGSPSTGQSTTLYITGDTVARVVTLPANVRSSLQQAVISTFTVPANWAGRIFLEKSAAGYDIDGEPTTLANKGFGGRFVAGANDTQVMVLSSWLAGTITNFITQSTSGTATYQLTINGTNITGGSNAVSTTLVNNAPSALNTFVVGDKVSIVRTADATCVNGDFAVYISPARL